MTLNVQDYGDKYGEARYLYYEADIIMHLAIRN